MENINNISRPVTVSLVGCGSMADMAAREGWTLPEYAVALADRIRHPSEQLSNQTERLVCLAAMNEEADRTGGEALAAHFLVLESLMMRFSLAAEEALGRKDSKGAEIAERYLSAAVKAQVAGVRVLGALKAIRDAPTRPAPVGGDDGPDDVEMLEAVLGKTN